MSIIHDAMKKAGEGNNARRPAAAAVSIQRSAPSSPAGRLNGGLLFVVTALLVIGAMLLAPLARGSRYARATLAPSFTPNAITVIRPTSADVSGQFGIEEMPNPGSFHLSGVVVSGEGSFGIINNQVVGLGQQVSGATVRSITGREVSLDYNGQKIILPVTDPNTL